MRVLNDYRCADGHEAEYFVDSHITHVECSTCGKNAAKVLRAPRVNLDPISGDFPGATMKWARDRESHMKMERKKADAHGKESLWEGADQSAKPKNKVTIE